MLRFASALRRLRRRWRRRFTGGLDNLSLGPPSHAGVGFASWSPISNPSSSWVRIVVVGSRRPRWVGRVVDGTGCRLAVGVDDGPQGVTMGGAR